MVNGAAPATESAAPPYFQWQQQLAGGLRRSPLTLPRHRDVSTQAEVHELTLRRNAVQASPGVTRASGPPPGRAGLHLFTFPLSQGVHANELAEGIGSE